MYRNDIIRLAVFMLVLTAVTLFNIWMLVSFISGPSVIHIPALSGIHALFFILFPVEAACLVYGFCIEGRWLQITEHTIETATLGPKEYIRFIHLSDLHLEKIGRNEKFLLKKTGESAPDMILLTGDYANYRSDYDSVALFLRKLASIAPCYLVAGNVDCNYIPELQALKDEFTFLESGVTTVDTGRGMVRLAGCDDSHAQMIPDAAREMDRLGSGFSILMYHKPDQADNPHISSFDLYLCGHTHGGQVRIPMFGAVITMSKLGKRYEMGEYRIGRTRMYVNRGFGFEGGSWKVPKVRFLCRPEIAFFTIKGIPS